MLEYSVITEEKIKEKIWTLQQNSAAGPDKIGPGLLQEVLEDVVPALKIITEYTLEDGEVPEDWRTANVAPIFKNCAKSNKGNYRPVSLTSACCKVLASIIQDDLMNNQLDSGLLKSSQHGFMARKSCTTNLLAILEMLKRAVDENKAMDVVLLDFAKAFDKVPHKRLMAQLRSMA
jgi:hypothetical protein